MISYSSIVDTLVGMSAGRLELIVLDDAYCLRNVCSKSYTLTAGGRHESKEDACKRIVNKIFRKLKGRHKEVWKARLGHFGIPIADNVAEFCVMLAIGGAGPIRGETL